MRRRRLSVKWVCNSRVTDVDEELLEEFKAAGCMMIGFGVESGNQEILDSMKKQITLDTAMEKSSNKDELQEMINRGVGVVPGAGLGRGPGGVRTPVGARG